MTIYSPNDTFTQAETYDLSDLVQGGPGGDANVPIKAAFDQANYVHNRLWRWQGVKTINGAYAIDPIADLGQYLVVTVAANMPLILPDAGSMPAGSRIPIHSVIAAIKSVSVLSQNGQRILDGSLSWLTWDTKQPGVYMHDAEKLILVACTDHWEVESAIGNFYTYGDSFGARLQRGNTLVGNGSLYNRADVPRLALLATSGANCVTDDTTWNSDPQTWRGLFSTGNNSTTLRIPDERGLSDRYLDLGRNLDLWRYPNVPGGFENEQIGQHTHPINSKYGTGVVAIVAGRPIYTPNQGITGGGSTASGISGGESYAVNATDNNSGLQNIVKNIGKIPLIKY